MYKVMLADDDYPVLELLSEIVEWNKLGFILAGTYENGYLAFEDAQKDPPDVLITDIGMPKMDGIELSRRLKQLHPSVRIAILSCHTDFHYAQQAMKLNVQEYLVKDALSPEDVTSLLAQFKEALDQERALDMEQSRLKHLVKESAELRKQKFFREFVEQPLLSAEQWLQDALPYVILQNGEHCLPVISYLEDYTRVKSRFNSEQTLGFAISNALLELTEASRLNIVHSAYNTRQSFFLFSFKPDLKQGIVKEVKEEMQKIQAELGRVLTLQMAVMFGRACTNPVELRYGLRKLTTAAEQRFYLSCGEITNLHESNIVIDNLFSQYHLAMTEFLNAMLIEDADVLMQVQKRWMNHIRALQYPYVQVKDWILKLVLDLKLKLHSLHLSSMRPSADRLHLEITEIDSLWRLEQWFEDQVTSLVETDTPKRDRIYRKEVQDACRYVSLHIKQRISLEEVARQLHLNASYFSRLFKKETGVTFIEYVTIQKMELAQTLLEQTNESVGHICEQLGYDNQSYFIKVFKTYYNVTPAEYRSTLKKAGVPRS